MNANDVGSCFWWEATATFSFFRFPFIYDCYFPNLLFKTFILLLYFFFRVLFQVRILNHITWTVVTEYKHASSVGDPNVVSFIVFFIRLLIHLILPYFTISHLLTKSMQSYHHSCWWSSTGHTSSMSGQYMCPQIFSAREDFFHTSCTIPDTIS